MDRYQGVPMLSTRKGKRYYQTVTYPDIPITADDIYIISTFGDRMDLLANDYYQDYTLYWVIMVANQFPRDSLFIPEGSQVRIPADTTGIIQAYNTLNGIQ